MILVLRKLYIYNLFVECIRATIPCLLGDLAATKDFESTRLAWRREIPEPNESGIRRRRTVGVNKKGKFSRSSQRDREKEKSRKRENRSVERILSYTIQVQVPSRTRHRKALKSPLKMSASHPARAGKVLGGRRWAGGGDCSSTLRRV